MKQFKVGDWVRVNLFESSGGLCSDNNIRRLTEEPEYIDDVPCYEVGFSIKVPTKYIELWQPKIAEWCWYGFELVQVIDVQPDHTKICRQKSPAYEEISQEKLKPFIDQLPDIVYEDIHYDDDNSGS